jgi:hypothetical protein
MVTVPPPVVPTALVSWTPLLPPPLAVALAVPVSEIAPVPAVIAAPFARPNS